jgi:hypothetical protein
VGVSMTARDRIVRPLRSARCRASGEIARGNVAPDAEASVEGRTPFAEATDQMVLLPGEQLLIGTDDGNLGSRRARDISQSDAASGGHA